jgi:hypothetical protein
MTENSRSEAAELVFKSLGFWQRNDLGREPFDCEDCIEGEPDESLMMSHILTCLGALVCVQRRRSNSLSNESWQFSKTVSVLSSLTVEAYNGFRSALDLSLSGYAEMTPKKESLRKASRVNIWLPIFWSAIIEDDAVSAMTLLLKNEADAIDQKLPLTDATIGHFFAGSFNCTIEVLKVLVARRPNLATLKDVHGNLMIHYAAKHGASVETLRYLLELDPTSIKAKGRGGNMPAHMLVTAASASSIQSLKYLLKQDPSVLTAVNDSGETPLHLSWGCWKRKLLAIPRMLLDMNSEAALMKDSQGQLPLFNICEVADFASADTIRLPSDAK